jgi:hypothetical protein
MYCNICEYLSMKPLCVCLHIQISIGALNVISEVRKRDARVAEEQASVH